EDGCAGSVSGDDDVVEAAGAPHNHVILLAIAVSTGYREVHIDFDQVGATDVVYRDPVGASLGVDVDPLDIIKVHGHGGDVSGQPHTRTISRYLEIFAYRASVEDEPVTTGLTFDAIVVIAWVPHKSITTGAQIGDVVAVSACDQIIALTAGECV